MTGNTDMHLLVTDTLKIVRGVDQNTNQYLVWPSFASCIATRFLRIELIRLLIVACGMLSPLLFNSCAKLLDIGGNWNKLSYTEIQSIPNMLNGWHVWWVCRTFSASRNCIQILATLSCWNVRWWRRMNGTTMGLRISSRYLSALVGLSLQRRNVF